MTADASPGDGSANAHGGGPRGREPTGPPGESAGADEPADGEPVVGEPAVGERIDEPAADVLVLGVGNDIKRDDAVGLLVADRLAETLDAPGVAVRAMTSGRIMLIEELSGYEAVYLVDSVVTTHGTPGDWYVLDPEDVEPAAESGGVATHNVGLGTLRTLGEAMGESMPAMTIFAIEVADPFEYGEELTAAMREALPSVVEAIEGRLVEELPGAELVDADVPPPSDAW